MCERVEGWTNYTCTTIRETGKQRGVVDPLLGDWNCGPSVTTQLQTRVCIVKTCTSYSSTIAVYLVCRK